MDLGLGKEFYGKKILIVDDEEGLVKLFSLVMKKVNFHTVVHTNPFEALKDFKERSDEYDIVLTDMTMPEMNGLELLDRIREIREDIPVIVCSGDNDEIDNGIIVKYKIGEYFSKPISHIELHRLVLKVLSGQELYKTLS